MWDVCQTAVFEEWWVELSEQEQDDVTAIVELLEEMGPKLPFPYSSGIEASRHSHMRELLIGGNKTGQEKRFYKTMIPKADALYDEHLKTLQAQPKP